MSGMCWRCTMYFTADVCGVVALYALVFAELPTAALVTILVVATYFASQILMLVRSIQEERGELCCDCLQDEEES